MASVSLVYEDDTSNPIAKQTVVNVVSADVDSVDETTDAEITYYLSAECTGQDTAKSPVFSGNYSWLGWIAPAAGSWTFHLRKTADDSSVANTVQTFD